jgi:zinc-binding in reverse transcriptase
VCSDIIELMRHTIQKRLIQSHYREKFGESYSHILWDVFQSAIKKSNITPAILKMVHNICPTQLHMVKLKKTIHSLCPCCNKAPEDIHHILIFQHRETLSRS